MIIIIICRGWGTKRKRREAETVVENNDTDFIRLYRPTKQPCALQQNALTSITSTLGLIPYQRSGQAQTQVRFKIPPTVGLRSNIDCALAHRRNERLVSRPHCQPTRSGHIAPTHPVATPTTNWCFRASSSMAARTWRCATVGQRCAFYALIRSNESSAIFS